MNALILGVILVFHNGDVEGWKLLAAFPTTELCTVSMGKAVIEGVPKDFTVVPLCIPAIVAPTLKPKNSSTHAESK